MRLLVSVRSLEEARIAHQGGADLIDVKEPLRGSLGRPDDDFVAAIADEFMGVSSVSAAMGELREQPAWVTPPYRITYLKFGLSKCVGTNWRDELLAIRALTPMAIVPAAYADFSRAESPSIAEVVEFVIANHFSAMLIDTYVKDGQDLLTWMTEGEIQNLAAKLRADGIDLALAGSLKLDHLPVLRRIKPKWFAVRGAVCHESRRESAIELERVRELKRAIAQS
ncbi:MAG: (5-formylfuran-3-yl)methyl phosphate synthase [Planctomycetes bacterium]|nr:(5-formylfuran-3-yl)methyl phosphate synthase [Planctomycetota bacterium]